jgi:hypothetical protein
MTTPEQPPAPDASAPPLSVLRAGAGRDINARRVMQVVVAIVLAGLTALSVLLFVAGAHKNEQIDNLRQHGVPVKVTVTGCMGLLGGSGSNAAGYACKVALEMDGHRYIDSLPGDAFYQPGAVVHAVAVPGDPGLLSRAATVAGEHASGRVFILPTVLLVVVVALAGVLFIRRRRTAGRRT